MTRHKDFGSAMLAYRSRPEGPIEPIQTNWTVVPTNDNADPAEVADVSFERNLLVTPSVQEIMRQVKDNKPERNAKGQIVRIGKLRFSDGAQTERAHTIGPDGTVIEMDARMPVGAMLGTIEKAKQQAGGKGYTQAQLAHSNGYFADVFGVDQPRYITRIKRKNGPSITADEARIELAKAIANTEHMPPIKKCPPALPCGAPRVADSFLGMQKGKKGESGAIAWEDIATHKVNREIWEETLSQLSKRDIATLDKAMEAATYEEVGVADGQAASYAKYNGGGKRRLIAANDNLSQALKLAS